MSSHSPTPPAQTTQHASATPQGKYRQHRSDCFKELQELLFQRSGRRLPSYPKTLAEAVKIIREDGEARKQQEEARKQQEEAIIELKKDLTDLREQNSELRHENSELRKEVSLYRREHAVSQQEAWELRREVFQLQKTRANCNPEVPGFAGSHFPAIPPKGDTSIGSTSIPQLLEMETRATFDFEQAIGSVSQPSRHLMASDPIAGSSAADLAHWCF
ncbi:hypothetical protein SISNIDRAFT_486637 [Sistotremastrum niveocremeum HHB9708]|uniref:Uncharacterized protein n=1 Tax=Sistotremastrum niveocremeum HHB9708 TaxID=1314777 RepID=A0A164T5P5_9AGAM|nr:hypothetical protein SISNIDRAFT_486637 [Sistotremastrum niveocremeum HHB9708]